MTKAVSPLCSEEIPQKFITLTVALAGVLPEYLAPFLTLACFCVFKRHFSLCRKKVKLGTVGKAFLLFLCYSLLSAFWSLTPIYSAAISLLWMGMLLGSFFVSNMTKTRERFLSLVKSFSLGGGIVGGIGLAQYLLLLCGARVPNPLWSVLDKLIYAVMPFKITATAAVWSASRAASTFDNPLICATYLILLLPVAVYGFANGAKRDRRLCGIAALLMLGGVASTTSRGAALAVLVSMVVLIFMNSRKALSVGITCLGSAAVFVIVLIKRYDILEVDLEKSTDSRLKMWGACLRLIGERPLFGYGAGCQSTSLGMLEYGIKKPHAHSLYIEMTTELGLVGALFLAAVFALIFYDIIKLIRKGGIYGKFGIASLAALLGFLVASLTEFTMQTPKELQFFMLTLGMLEAAKRLSAQQPVPTEKATPAKKKAACAQSTHS